MAAASVSNNDMGLLQAVKDNDVEKVRMFIEKGANVNYQYVYSGETALIIATRNGNSEIVKLLIDAGADIHLENEDGNTALLEGQTYKSIESANVIVKSDKEYDEVFKVDLDTSIEYYDIIDGVTITTTIKEFITDNSDNIVFQYVLDDEKERYYPYKRSYISSAMKYAIFYPCLDDNSSLSPENVVKKVKLFQFNKISLPMGGYGYDFDNIVDTDNQIFILKKLMKYPSFTSKRLMDGQTNMVSGLHCSEGHDAFVYTVDTWKGNTSVSSVTTSGAGDYTGGRRKRNTRKHRNKKRKQTKHRKPKKSARKHKRRVKKRKQTKRRSSRK